MRKLLKWSGISIGFSTFALGTYLIGIQLTGNFAAVLPGELYRSNQPTPSQLASYVQQYGIKTVVNLRGSSEKASWYKDEIAAARELGLTHIDFAMSASKELSLDRANQLVAILRDAPKPLLIHCKSGSDRTGLASVIYLNRVASIDESAAERQLSIRFGHVGIPFLSPTYAMDESWERIEATGATAG